MVRGRSSTLTSVVAKRPVAVSSIDGAEFGFAPIRRARLPPLCPQPEHTSCRFPLLRRTHCFTREDRLRTIDQTVHRGAARLIPVHINELPSPRRASAHRRGPPRTARPKPPSAYSADGGFQLPATRLSATIQFNPRSSGTLVPQKEPGATILFRIAKLYGKSIEGLLTGERRPRTQQQRPYYFGKRHNAHRYFHSGSQRVVFLETQAFPNRQQ